MSMKELDDSMADVLGRLGAIGIGASSAAASVDTATTSITTSVNSASSAFSQFLSKVSGYSAGLRPVEGGNDGAYLTAGDLLTQLATLLTEQRGIQRDPNLIAKMDPLRVAAIESGIQNITQLIKQALGRDADKFTVEEFKRFIFGDGTTAIVSAVKNATAPRATAGTRLDLGQSAYSPTADEEISLDEEQKKIEAATSAAEKLHDTIALDKLQAANDELQRLAEQSGVVAKSKAVDDLNAQLDTARNTLQYLIDEKKPDSAINAQRKAIDDLEKQLAKAQDDAKQAAYDFTHSDAYKAQRATVDELEREVQIREQAEKQLEPEQKQIEGLTKSATAFRAEVTAAQQSLQDASGRLDEANEKLKDMADAVGVTGKSKAVEDLNAQLQEARDTLQYLHDTNGRDDAIEKTQKSIDDLQEKITKAEKQARIASYEFTHSDAYKAQLAEIAAAKAEVDADKKDLDAKKKIAEEQQRQIEALQKDLEAKRAKLDEMAQRLASTGEKNASDILKAGDSAAKTIKSAAGDIVKAVTRVLTNSTTPATTTLPNDLIAAAVSKGTLP